MAESDPQQVGAPISRVLEDAHRRQDLEDAYEDLLLAVLAGEEDWRLDDRIAYALRREQRRAA
jgi:hypothetical protein